MLKTRIVTAIVALPIVALLAALGHPWFTLGIAVGVGGGAYELGNMAQKMGHDVRPWLCAGSAVAVCLALGFGGPTAGSAVLSAMLVLWAVWYVLHANSPTRSEALALSVFSTVYVGYLGAHLAALRLLPQGIAWLCLAVVTVWITDSGAYFVGRAWGRALLAPALSPKKTWAGVGGGVVFGALGGMLIAVVGGLGWPHGLVIGVISGVLCPFGDLLMSMIKRGAQVKDSGTIFPGHGGWLDRTDTLLVMAPLTYYYVVLVARILS